MFLDDYPQIWTEMQQRLIYMQTDNRKQIRRTLNRSGRIDQKKYRCIDCDRLYETKSAMNYHRKWICSDQQHFRCPYCVYQAKRFYCFKEHLERKHKIKALSKQHYLHKTGGGSGGGTNSQDIV